jgi:tetratricopeptide (TPR) repeat protein
MKNWVRILLGLSLGISLTALAWAGQDTSKQGSQQPPAQGGQQSGQEGQQGGAAAGQAAGAPAAPQVTPEQLKDFQAIQNELDPDKQMQLVETFAKTYPNTTPRILSDVYFFGAAAAQNKGDVAKVVDYGEKSLKLDGDNLRALLILASVLPQPQAAKALGGDPDKYLTEAEGDANKALQVEGALTKQTNQTDDQFQQMKDAITSAAHSALGMVHLVRATEALAGIDAGELAKAEQEYKTAVSVPSPDPEAYYRLGEAYRMDNKIDEAIDAFSKASQLGQGGPLQSYADQQVEALKKKKAEGQNPPAKP